MATVISKLSKMFNLDCIFTNQKVNFCRSAPLKNKLARRNDRSILKALPHKTQNRNAKLVKKNIKPREKSENTMRKFTRRVLPGGGWGSVQHQISAEPAVIKYCILVKNL